MNVDINIVVYRPQRADLIRTFESLSQISSEFRSLNLLVSGGNTDAQLVDDVARASGVMNVVHLIHRFDNIGFAAGHNLLLQRAFTEGAEYVLVLNPDMEIANGAITNLVGRTQELDQASLVGPSLYQVSENRSEAERLTDSMGIKWNLSGRHFDANQGERWNIASGEVSEEKGLTGACLLVSRPVHEEIVMKTGWFFDSAFLAYREDAELGIRASLIGISSLLVQLEGFGHVRSVRGYERGKTLPDMLGVRNRFLLRWRLGRHRPGVPFLSTARDLLVVFAAATTERSSWPGVQSAFAIRRSLRNGGAERLALRRSA